MKSLTEYLMEQRKDGSSKSFTFDFTGMEEAKETVEALTSSAGENISYSADEQKVSFTLTKDNFSEATAFITALKDYVKKLGSITTKRSSDTQFADKVNKMEHKIEELDRLIASFSTEETEEQKDKQQGDDEKTDDETE